MEIKCIQIEKGELKLSLFTGDNCICRKSQRIQKLLEWAIIERLYDIRLISQEFIAVLDTSIPVVIQLEFEVNTALFTLVPEKIKYLSINVTR